jgi:hypothetical protein
MPFLIEGRHWMTAAEAAEVLQIRENSVRTLARVGKLKRRTDTGSVLIELRSVYDYAESRGPWPPHGVYGGKAALEENPKHWMTPAEATEVLQIRETRARRARPKHPKRGNPKCR